jgi:hypothetical protein
MPFGHREQRRRGVHSLGRRARPRASCVPPASTGGGAILNDRLANRIDDDRFDIRPGYVRDRPGFGFSVLQDGLLDVISVHRGPPNRNWSECRHSGCSGRWRNVLAKRPISS